MGNPFCRCCLESTNNAARSAAAEFYLAPDETGALVLRSRSTSRAAKLTHKMASATASTAAAATNHGHL